MERGASEAIQSVFNGQLAYCKFLSANDAGSTGGHQSGILISKTAIPIMFDSMPEKTGITDRWVKILWQNGQETNSRFIYYSSKNELRITGFGRGFPFLKPEQTGSLFILVKEAPEYYRGFFLDTEDEINQFLDAFGISTVETNSLIRLDSTVALESRELEAIMKFVKSLDTDFPVSEIMSAAARTIHNSVYNHEEYIRLNPDKKLIDWTNTEYRLFRACESAKYGSMISQGFSSVEDFISIANQVLNRRKSRAGRSLEHHLAAIFDGNSLIYEAQAVTEGNKKPDFLFPSREAYHNPGFPTEKIISLAAKTTCKDRWRQVLNEADRLKNRTKYLCTLQQGISSSQLMEMDAEKVVLVVPKPYISSYPRERQNRIWTLNHFIGYVKEAEGLA